MAPRFGQLFDHPPEFRLDAQREVALREAEQTIRMEAARIRRRTAELGNRRTGTSIQVTATAHRASLF